MQYKAINLIADRLGESNAFAMEECSSLPSSLSGSEDLSEPEFFKDIKKYKDDLSFSDSRVTCKQNLLNVSEVITKEMELDKRKAKSRTRISIAVSPANDSKASHSRASSVTPGQSPFPGKSTELKPRFAMAVTSKPEAVHRKSLSQRSTPKGNTK